MIKSYINSAWRNLKKNKIFSAINILGLAIGMAACMIILIFVIYEKGFDAQHKKNIYRLDEVQKFPGMLEPQNVALSMFPMGPTLLSDFPEVKSFVRVRNSDKVDLAYNDHKVNLPTIKLVDSNFLSLFDFKLKFGTANTVLVKKNSIVLTEETAEKMFGKQEAVGKTVTLYSGDTTNFIVTGILYNIPENSHLQFSALLSFSTIIKPDFINQWGGNWLVTYLELSKSANVAAMQKRFPDYLKKYMGTNGNDGWKYYELFLQSLKDVHSGSTNITHDYQNYQKFDGVYTYIFSIIAIVILLIACINFMNLSTAKSAERAREVGVRKAIGAERGQLTFQFIGESVFLSFLALLLAILLVISSLPSVRLLSERELHFPLFSSLPILLSVIGGTVLIGVISGIYPALFLSSFKPIKVLKGALQTGSGKLTLRNVLVVGQFTGAIFLIIATVFVLRQLNFMQKKDPGFNKEQVMIIPLNRQANEKYETLKNELVKNSLVLGVTASQQTLGNNLHQSGMIFHSGDTAAREMATSQVVVDPDYLTLYKIEIIAGRNFSKDYATDNAKAYIINETMAKELLKNKPNAQLSSLIGKQFGVGGMDSAGSIVGISKDFNFNSLHHKIETLVIMDQKDWGFNEMSVKINGDKAKEAIAFVANTWKQFGPDHPFDYSFLDEHFQELYKADKQVSIVVSVLATLAIIISCLGLFGLASYSAERKIKEIGIRKVLGASVKSIVLLLSGDFIKLIFIANLIAIPLAWWAMNKWLQDFAYRTSLVWWVFVFAAAMALIIALFTISFQAVKAAIANPVKSLRTE